MRGLLNRGARRRACAGAILALLFVMSAVPVQAAPAWKDAVTEIETIRDEAMTDLVALGSEFQEFLDSGPTAEEAAEELADVLEEMGEVGIGAVEEIRVIVDEFPRSPEVQQTGSFAIGLINAAEAFSKDFAIFRYNQYIENLPPGTDPPSTSTTTTTTSPTTTTTSTTSPPITTTLPTTTTSPTTTTTFPSTTTTTSPTTTTTTAPATTTTTRPTVSAGRGDTPIPPSAGETDPDEGAALEVAPPGRIIESARQGTRSDRILEPGLFGETGLSSTTVSNQRGITASLTRVLEPHLPTEVAEVVVSPLLIFELIWRAISSSGRGLVAPISLLLFTVLSLLWDWRRSRRATSAAPA